MKNDFEFFNPTQVFFGRSAMENLSSVLSLYGDRVLLAYGSGSIRSNGVYDQVMNTLQACGKTVTEFSGILPNPTYEKVLEGGHLARASQADLILAVGLTAPRVSPSPLWKRVTSGRSTGKTSSPWTAPLSPSALFSRW